MTIQRHYHWIVRRRLLRFHPGTSFCWPNSFPDFAKLWPSWSKGHVVCCLWSWIFIIDMICNYLFIVLAVWEFSFKKRFIRYATKVYQFCRWKGKDFKILARYKISLMTKPLNLILNEWSRNHTFNWILRVRNSPSFIDSINDGRYMLSQSCRVFGTFQTDWCCALIFFSGLG